MLKRTLACALALSAAATSARAQTAPLVVTDDIDIFWAAFDSAVATTDSAEQVRIVRERYIEAGTPGVRAFMAAKGYTAEGWARTIRRYPRFWASIRPNTYRLLDGVAGLDGHLARFRELYPELRPARIYFTMGALQSGGTTQDSTVLIGAELAAGTPETDLSEFSQGTRDFLARVYSTRPATNLVPLAVHEYVHTQQRGASASVLARALEEGGADFVTELVTGQRMNQKYMTYGPAHEAELKARFRAQMFTGLIGNWFYNQVSDDPEHVPDLGYYMGYAIARAYHGRAADKRAAVREIIQLDFGDEAAVEAFLRRSGYFAEPFDRAELTRAYEAARPTVLRLVPNVGAPIPAEAIARGTVMIDPAATELRFEFSRAMSGSTGTGLGPGGAEQSPLAGERPGWSADRSAYTYRVKLEPGRTYGFVLEGSEEGGFSARDGYPLRPLTLVFTTPAPR